MRLKLISYNLMVMLLFCVVTPHFSLADDEDALKYFQQGEDYFSNGKYDRALDLYRRALRENSSSNGTITITTETVKTIPYGRTVKKEVVRDYNTKSYFPGRRIAEIEGILQEQARRLEEMALPCNLVVTARFVDSDKVHANNALDAGEDATLFVTVKNNGQGKGYATKLEVSVDNSEIDYVRTIDVGDISPGDEQEIKVKLNASLDVRSGKTPILLNLKEKRSYDARKVQLNIQTAKLDRPKLDIVSTEINDGDTGRAEGNGNGIPESGETVELVAYIKNNGEGDAIGVKLQADRLSSGLDQLQDSTSLETIRPGDTVKAKIAFKIPINFDSEKISLRLKVADERRGVSDAEKKVEYAFGKLSPDIRYAWRILSASDRKQVETITNGEKYFAELTLSNSGKISARNVEVRVDASDGAEVFHPSKEVGEIKEQATLPPQLFELNVPRTYSGENMTLSAKVSQTHFRAVPSEFSIPVNIKRPKLKYLANIQGKGGGSTIEQGEMATLAIQVLNEGMLVAEGVKVKIKSNNENLKVIDKKEAEELGRITPQSQGKTAMFRIQATKRLKSGQQLLDVVLKQNDFGEQRQQFALNVQEETIDVVDVAEEVVAKPSKKLARNVAGPTINIKSKVLETEAESFMLAFDVMDGMKNIDPASVRVIVNNALVPIEVNPGFTKQQQILANVSLKEGENRVVISARNTDNTPCNTECSIFRKPEEDVNIAPVTGIRNPDAIAVVIGISKYRSDEIPKVDFARKDAETMKEYLVKTFGFSRDRIAEFYDEKATATELKKYFKTTFKRNITKPGVSDVFVFYSGHGTPDTNTNEAYLVPHDYDSQDPETTGFKVKDLYSNLETLKAKSVTVVLDACFSGQSNDGKFLIKNASPMEIDVTNPVLKMNNGVVLSSSSGKQISSWYNKKQHGLFTYYLLQGFKGKADENKDGVISVKEIEDYLKTNVSFQAQALYNRNQTPEAVGDKDSILVKLK